MAYCFGNISGVEGGHLNDEFTLILVGVLLFAAVLTGGNYVLSEFSVNEDLPGLEAGQELADKTGEYTGTVGGVSEADSNIGVIGLINLIYIVFVDGIQFATTVLMETAAYLNVPTSFIVFIIAIIVIILTVAAIKFLRGVTT